MNREKRERNANKLFLSFEEHLLGLDPIRLLSFYRSQSCRQIILHPHANSLFSMYETSVISMCSRAHIFISFAVIFLELHYCLARVNRTLLIEAFEMFELELKEFEKCLIPLAVELQLCNNDHLVSGAPSCYS